MSDDLEIPIEVSLDDKASSGASSVVDSLSKITDTAHEATENLEALENQFRNLERAARDYSRVQNLAKAQVGGRDQVAKPQESLMANLGVERERQQQEKITAGIIEQIDRQLAVDKKARDDGAAFADKTNNRIAESARNLSRHEIELQEESSRQFARSLKTRLEAQERAAKESARIAKDEAERMGDAAHNARKFDEAAHAESSKQFAQGLQQRMQAEVDLEKEQKRAAQERIKDEENYQNSLSNTRYALYDVASMYQRIAAASAAGAAAVIGTGAVFEDAFVNVARTADLPVDGLEKLRRELVDLSTEIPVLFTDLSEISTLGGQMDIAGDKLAGFSENVAMFAATTDATVEQTAMSFGRIVQLTGSSQDDFNRVASAIYEVGVSTVATESQILTMSEQLAASGNMAGFSAQEIIGLSGALASLGVQPERARGSMERAFNAITAAVDSGGERLIAFAKTSGMSAAEFSAAWKDRPAEAFQSLIAGMSRAVDQGANFQELMKNMGIGAVRDLDTFRRLTSNVEYLTMAMNTSTEAWKDGDKHAEAFALTADTVVAKAKKLANTFLAVFDVLNSNELVKGALDMVQGLVGGVKDLMQAIDNIPVIGDRFGALVTGMLAFSAAYATVMAGMITFRASLMALETALYRMNATSNGVSFSIRGMFVEISKAIKNVMGYKGAVDQASVSNRGLSASVQGASGSIAAQSGAAKATAASLGTATTAATGLSASMRVLRTVGKTVLPVLVISEAINLLSYLNEQWKTAADLAKETSLSWSGLGSALEKDAETFRETGEAIAFIANNMEGSIFSAGEYLTYEEAMAQALVKTNGNREEAILLLDRYTMALGNAQALEIRDEILGDDLLRERIKSVEESLAELGITTGEVYAALASGGEEAAAMMERIGEAAKEYTQKSYEASQATGKQFLEQNSLLEKGQELADLYSVYKERMESVSSAQEELALKSEYAAEMNEILGISLEDVGDSAQWAEIATASYGDTLFGATLNAAQFEESMFALGESIAVNGETIDIYSANGRANMQAIASAVSAAAAAAGNDSTKLANFLGAILNSVGFANGSLRSGFVQMLGQLTSDPAELARATSIMDNYAGSAGRASYQAGQLSGQMKNLTNNMKGAGGAAKPAAKGIKDVGKSAKDAKKDIRTLSDYVSDLRSVMSAAFSFRWDLDRSIDDIKDKYHSIEVGFRDAAEKARDLRQQLRDLKAEQASLSAGRDKLEYQLKVAIDYGDDLRVKEIQAELAKNTEATNKKLKDQSNTSRELVDAQKEVKRDLSGTTEASRDQRANVLDLLSAYQKQIEALAATGISQKELERRTKGLKAEFEAQMRQMGYSEEEIRKYSKTFDDMTKIIKNVPKGLTIKVDANTSPADKALKEFNAKRLANKKAKADVDTSRAHKKIDSLNRALGGIGGGSGGGGVGFSTPEESSNQPVDLSLIPKGMGHFPEDDTYRRQGKKAGESWVGGVMSTLKSNLLVARSKLETPSEGTVKSSVFDKTQKVLNRYRALLPTSVSNPTNQGAVQSGNAAYFQKNPTSLPTKVAIPGNRSSTLVTNRDWYANRPTKLPTTVSNPENRDPVLTSNRTWFSGRSTGMPTSVTNPDNKSTILSTIKTWFSSRPTGMPTSVRTPGNKSTILSTNRTWFGGRSTGMPTRVRTPGNRTTVLSNNRSWFSSRSTGMPSKVNRPGNLSSVRYDISQWFRWNPVNMAGQIKATLAKRTGNVFMFGYKDGGFTGRGNSNDIAGVAHKGEYVIPASGVNQSTGLPTMSALGELMRGNRSPSSSRSAGAAGMIMPSVMVVELSPTDRKLIADSGGSVVVLDGKVLTSTVNNNNANNSQRGL